MSTPVAPLMQPSRRPYVIASILFTIAIALGLVLAIVFVRAFTGYTVTTFDAGRPTTVTVGDRDVTIWSSVEVAPATCSSVDAAGKASKRTGMTSMPNRPHPRVA